MKQPVKGGKKIKTKKSSYSDNPSQSRKRKHKQEYGTSKLECDFAHDFLDKLGLKYVYEYCAKDIKRYFDFAVTAIENYPYKYVLKEGINSIDQDAQLFIPDFMIEVDGDYW